jgi:hypothetical protein
MRRHDARTPSNERQAFDREAALPAQETELKATLPVRPNRADQAGLVVQDLARSSVKKPVHGASCPQCRHVITGATLKLLDTKYKAHLRTCLRAPLA